MARLIHASLSILAAIAAIALVVGGVLPVQARSSAAPQPASADILATVLVEHPDSTTSESSCPALSQTDDGSSCPYLAGKEGQMDGASAQCPYLAKKAAGSGCPALKDKSERSDDAACPFAAGTLRPEAESQPLEDEGAPKTLDL